MTGGARPMVLFYVQHLLGIGHLKRAATLVRAFDQAGMDVTLVSGGEETPGLDIGGARFVQLDSVRAADRYFKVLVDSSGRQIDDAFKALRRDALLSLLAETAPDVLVTELFPFGRRQLSFELIPLLDAAMARDDQPAVVCSVRDILVEPGKPERVDEMYERLRRYYDLVLVHGDPALAAFGDTFSLAHRIENMMRYTGYVVGAARPDPGGAGTGEVIVSAGGGAVSEPLFRAAMAARQRTRLARATWRMLAGVALPDEVFRALQRDAPDGVAVERARPDFTTLLANCVLSLSQGGYNTVMEVLAARARAVIVPYAGGLETEQTLRAERIGARAGLQVVAENAISPETIAEAVEAAMDGAPADPGSLDIGGAAESARLVMDLARRRRAS
jgi:predicted glycosyltransferase